MGYNTMGAHQAGELQRRQGNSNTIVAGYQVISSFRTACTRTAATTVRTQRTATRTINVRSSCLLMPVSGLIVRA